MSSFEIRTVTGERHTVEAEKVRFGDDLVTFIDGEDVLVAAIPVRQLSLVRKVSVAIPTTSYTINTTADPEEVAKAIEKRQRVLGKASI